MCCLEGSSGTSASTHSSGPHSSSINLHFSGADNSHVVEQPPHPISNYEKPPTNHYRAPPAYHDAGGLPLTSSLTRGSTSLCLRGESAKDDVATRPSRAGEGNVVEQGDDEDYIADVSAAQTT